MKKNYSLVLIAFLCFALSGYGQTKLAEITFETAGGYTTSVPEFIDGGTDYFTRTDGSNIGGAVSLSNIQGSFYFAAQDTDGDGNPSNLFLNFNNINISGYTNLQFRIHLAEDDDGSNQDWDADSYVHISGTIDTNPSQNIIWVESSGATNTEPAIDTNFNGSGNGTAITSTFTQFIENITGTGSNLDIEIEFNNLNAGDEDIAIDSIEIWGISSCSDELNFVNIQSPSTTQTITQGDNFDVYSQAYDALYTLLPGASANVEAWIGYNTVNNNPNNSSWTWISAGYDTQIGNNDQYLAEIGSGLPVGTYYYASRYRLNGCGFTYGGTGGNWNNDSVQLIVEADQVNFCNVDFPKAATIPAGNPHNVYAQAFEPGVTDAAGQGANLEAWIGYTTVGINHQPWQVSGWTWVAATYDSDSGNNDQYVADIGTGRPAGTYYYASRFRLNGSDFSYGGIASDNVGNFWDATNNNGTLIVSNPPNNATAFSGCFTDTTVSLTWNAPATGTTPDGYVIFVRTGATDPNTVVGNASDYNGFNTDFSIAPTASANLGKYVYKGAATNATITGLTEDALYSFTVYAYAGEAPTGWANGGTNGSTITNEQAQGDVRNLVATPLTNQVNLNWNNPLPTSCFDQLIIVANSGAVTFTPTGTYANTDVDYSTPNSIVFSTTSTVSVNSVNGLTNGTNYCFKVFIRRGATWSEGVEVCAVPSLTYCASFGNTSYDTGTTGVVFNTISNLNTNTDVAYSDFTSFSTTVTLGETYNLDVRVNTDGSFNTTTRVWIDWNNDGDFGDSNEDYELGNAFNVANGSTDGSPLAIEIPTNAVIAATRMRVSTIYNLTPTTPCQTGFDGEVEDYTINIIQPVNAEINVKGNNITISNGFNAPYGLNNTLFGAQNVGSTSAFKNYFVENIGATSLNLNGAPRVDIIGAHAGDFIVTLQPSATVSSLSNSEFRIVFSPTADGTRTATVRIENTDSDEDPYEFDIQGNAVCSTTLTSSMWPTEGPENTEVTITSVNNLTGATATINGDTMTVVSSNATELVVLVPAGAISGNLEVLFSTGCSSSNSFTVIDSVIGGCETAAASTVPSDLFITEISDASSGSSSLIEIFNGTTTTKNLANYSIRIFNNGSASSTTTANLIGSLAPGELHVISIGTTTCDLYGNGLNGALPDQSFNSAGGINFDNNSSDAIQLFNGGTPIDSFGVTGSSTWANGLTIGDDGVNYRRQNTAAVLPSTTFDITEWDEFDWTTCGDSDYSNFGQYDFSLGIPPSVSVLNSPTFSCTTNVQLIVSGSEGVPNGLGLAYQWYYLVPTTNTFVVVPSTADFNNDSTSATLDIINPLPYIDYQFYCRVGENNTLTCYTASNAVKLTVVTTIWDGSDWTASTPPDEDTIAIIDGPYDTSTNGDIDACRLVINSGVGRTLNVANSGYVRVVNNVLNNGAITVQTHGAFVQDGLGLAGNGTSGTFINNGSASVIKYTELLNDWYEYTYWSSPVLNQALNDATPNTPASRRFYFETANYLDEHTDETTNGIPDDIDDNGDDWVNATGNTMELGRGYAATSSPMGMFPQTDQATFDGEFFTGDLFKSVIRNGFAGDNDWNFVGNPYASAIDFDDLHTENNTIIDGAAYLWSQALPPLDTNPGNQGLNFNDADYAIITVGSGNTAGGSGVIPAAGNFIPSAQGFFVKAINAGGNLRFTNQMRRADNTSNNQFFRSSNPENDISAYETNRLWVNLTSESGVFNQILIAYVDGATNGEDSWSYDAPRNLSSGLSSVIYTSIENVDTRYAIQGKSPSSLTIEEVIPVGFKTNITQATLYTFSIAQLEGEFMNENIVYLKDKLMNIIHDLSANDYAFTSEIGEFNDRFEIVFQAQALSVNENELTPNELTIVELGNGDVTFSVGKNMTIDAVEILDMLGRTIYKLRGQNSTETYNLSNLSQATYIARVTLSNGQTITKKAVKMN